MWTKRFMDENAFGRNISGRNIAWTKSVIGRNVSWTKCPLDEESLNEMSGQQAESDNELISQQIIEKWKPAESETEKRRKLMGFACRIFGGTE